jgi:hypothetical protein
MTITRSKYRARCCNECGTDYSPRRADEFYCSTPCRKAFDNRAMTRGRDLYHLFMAMRYERGLAKGRGLWAIACRLAQEWRAEDDAERGGRKSWQSVTKSLDRLPVVMTTKDVYVRPEKIGRAS